MHLCQHQSYSISCELRWSQLLLFMTAQPRAALSGTACGELIHSDSRSLKVCEVGRRRVRVLLERLQVLLDRLERKPQRSQVDAADVQIFVRI